MFNKPNVALSPEKDYDDLYDHDQNGGSQTLFLVNDTPLDLFFIDRFNVTTICPRHSGNSFLTNKFKICKRYTFKSNKVIIDALKHYTNITNSLTRDIGNEDIFLVRDALINNAKANSHTTYVSIIISRSYPKSIVDAHVFRAYIPEYDILVDSNYVKDKSIHPESNIGKTIYKHMDQPPKVSSMFIEVDLVDNESKYGTKYVYSCGKVLSVEPIRDPNRQSGVYFTLGSGENKLVNQYTYEEAKSILQLSDTQESALSANSISEQQQRQLEETIQRLKHENLINTQTHEKLINDLRVKAKQDELEATRVANDYKMKHDQAMRDSELQHKQAMADMDLKYKAILAEMELKVQQSKKEAAITGSASSSVKSELDMRSAYMEQVHNELKRTSALYYDELNRRSDLSQSIIKYGPAVLAGAGAVLLANKLMSNSIIPDNIDAYKW